MNSILNKIGDTNATIIIDNGISSVSKTIPIHVTPVNDAPLLSGTANNGTENVAYSWTPMSSDVDNSGNDFTFGAFNLPSWASINFSTGELTGTPGLNDVGIYNDINLSINDGIATTYHIVSITINGENKAPSITSDGGADVISKVIIEGTKDVTTIVASDANSNSILTYSISAGKDASKFDIDSSTGKLIFRNAPSYENPSDTNGDNSYEVIVKVKDQFGLEDTQTVIVNVVQQPQIVNITPMDGSKDVPIDSNITVTFNKEIDISTIDTNLNGSFVVTDFLGNFVEGNIATKDNKSFVFTPNNSLNMMDKYTITLTSSITGTQGISIINPQVSYFTTPSIDFENEATLTCGSNLVEDKINGQTSVDINHTILGQYTLYGSKNPSDSDLNATQSVSANKIDNSMINVLVDSEVNCTKVTLDTDSNADIGEFIQSETNLTLVDKNVSTRVTTTKKGIISYDMNIGICTLSDTIFSQNGYVRINDNGDLEMTSLIPHTNGKYNLEYTKIDKDAKTVHVVSQVSSILHTSDLKNVVKAGFSKTSLSSFQLVSYTKTVSMMGCSKTSILPNGTTKTDINTSKNGNNNKQSGNISTDINEKTTGHIIITTAKNKSYELNLSIAIPGNQTIIEETGKIINNIDSNKSKNSITINPNGQTEHKVTPFTLETNQLDAKNTLEVEFGMDSIKHILGDINTSIITSTAEKSSVTIDTNGTTTSTGSQTGCNKFKEVKIVTYTNGESQSFFLENNNTLTSTTKNNTVFEIGNQGSIRVNKQDGCPYIDINSSLTKQVIF